MLNVNFIAILLGNIILSAPLPMLIVMSALGGALLAPEDWLATAPMTAQLLVGIFVAAPLSLLMGRYGRRSGFLTTALTVIVGGVLGAAAIYIGSFMLLCVAHGVLGVALIGVRFYRFAAAEAVPSTLQAQAISLALASGLVAALLGPEAYKYAKDLLAPTPLAGAYLAISALGVLGALPMFFLKLPLPAVKSGAQRDRGAWRALIARPEILRAMGVGALSQAMMVLLMVPTPLAMVGCGFLDETAADVVRWHVIAMFAPGFVTGSLIQRFGSERVAGAGMLLLLVSAAIAFSGVELANFYWSLIMLGVGWNFGFIGGTHMLQAALREDERALAQGVNDTLVAILSAAAALLSGVLYSGIGWAGLTALSGPVLILGGAALLWRARNLARAAAE